MAETSAASEAIEPDQDILRKLGRKVRSRLNTNQAAQKVAVDKAELWAVSGFFDAIECGRLITMIDAVARPSIAQGGYSDASRTSFSGDLDPRDPFVASLQKRIDDLVGMAPANGERIEGQRYLPGQQFSPHTDWFPPGTEVGAEERRYGGQRAVTAMAYLNQVEEGGETDFPYLGIAIRPRPGTLLVWNNADENGMPNPWTVHAGNQVTRGVKYIITKWYRTHKWIAR